MSQTLRDISLRYTAEGLRTFAYVERRPATVEVLRSALLTRRDYGPDRTVTGAVHDRDGLLYRPALRPATAPEDLSHADPERVERGAIAPARRIATALYGGVLFGTLGHFLFETLARLWMLRDMRLRGGKVAFHPWPDLYLPDIFRNALYAAILRALGLSRRDVLLVHLDDVEVGTLFCPSPLSVMHAALDPAMGELLDFVADEILTSRRFAFRRPGAAGMPRVFLSRSRWSANSRIRNETDLDGLFAEHGFAIVHPQETRPRELLGLLRGAGIVAATDGSHAHLATFCRPGTRTFMLDTRTVPTQFAIARLKDLRSLHVPLADAGLIRDGAVDVRALASDMPDLLRDAAASLSG